MSISWLHSVKSCQSFIDYILPTNLLKAGFDFMGGYPLASSGARRFNSVHFLLVIDVYLDHVVVVMQWFKNSWSVSFAPFFFTAGQVFV